MSATPDSSRCWNCEETVHPYAVHCPYCGSDLAKHKEQESVATSPPFDFKEVSEEASMAAVPFTQPSQQLVEVAVERQQPDEISTQTVILPLGLLLPGTVFLLFGLVMLLYSQNGVFTLHWNGTFWPYYLLLASVLLYFGYRSLDQVQDK